MIVPAQDPHAQPPDMGRAVHAIHTPCGVPAACSPHHRWSADDGLHRVDDTCGPVASGDPHIPPSVCGDHSGTAGHRHDPWSSHRRHVNFWDDVSKRVEGLRRGCYRPSTPLDIPANQKDEKMMGIHSEWLSAHFNTCPEW
jgi:hypothetical protein